MAETATIEEIDLQIAAIRGNLRALLEQATALSGAADESRISDRIEAQEAKLSDLLTMKELAAQAV